DAVAQAAGPRVRVLPPAPTVVAARAGAVTAATGDAVCFLPATDLVADDVDGAQGVAARAVDALGDAAMAWVPQRRVGDGPLARVAAGPLRLADAAFRTDLLREVLADPGLEDDRTDTGLRLAALAERRATDGGGLRDRDDLDPWCTWQRRDHALPFGFDPDLAAELEAWLPTAEAAWATAATGAAATRSRWARGLLVALLAHLPHVERVDDGLWARSRTFALPLADALEETTGTEDLGVWARAALGLLRADDRVTLAALELERWRHPEDLRTTVRAAPGHLVEAVLPGGPVPLTPAETPAWASLRRMTVLPGSGLVLQLLTGIRHLDLADHPPEVEVALVGGGARHPLRVGPAPGDDAHRVGGLRFVDQAPGACSVVLPEGLLTALPDGRSSFEVVVRAGGLERRTALADHDPRGSAGEPAVLTHGGRTLRATFRARRGLEVEVAASSQEEAVPSGPAAVVEDCALVTGADGGPVLVLRGRAPDHAGRSLELVAGSGTAASTTEWDGDEFVARVALQRPATLVGTAPAPAVLLPPAAYRVRWDAGPDRLVAPPSGELLTDLPRVLPHPAARLEVRRGVHGSLVLVVGPGLAPAERGPFAQQRLVERYLAAEAEQRQLDPAVVYLQSFAGATPTDSPAAIAAELRRRAPHLRLVWGVADASVPVPEGCEAVTMRTAAWFDILATAAHLVVNIDLEPWFRLRPGQRLLQSFHGYPSKSMGLDLWRAKNMPPGRVERMLDRTQRAWSAILTPSPEMNRHYREQYAYDGPIIDVGYPRDDALLAPDADRRRAEVRAALGIADDVVAVLHAPTWRDDLAQNFRAAADAGHVDPEAMAAALGPSYVVLQRGHRFHAHAGPAGPGVIDVGDHPEINDLVLASDVAVLDYSSLRFDYALTGRPMVFCVPDLADYAGSTRGFLFPFEESAPGPLLATQDEVVAALRDLPGLRSRYAASLTSFNERFHPVRDGRAAERVVDAFFGDVPG
ncbi:MAG: CDP-glycerol glycerophosphotransferase family protein, partial [Nocardioides sp.]|nr:CDP-glycerol glycerophosphotransferase family protein [Nocardioides sp.]